MKQEKQNEKGWKAPKKKMKEFSKHGKSMSIDDYEEYEFNIKIR